MVEGRQKILLKVDVKIFGKYFFPMKFILEGKQLCIIFYLQHYEQNHTPKLILHCSSNDEIWNILPKCKNLNLKMDQNHNFGSNEKNRKVLIDTF